MPKRIPIAVIRAAEARALGHSWQVAAAEAGWTLDGLRRWIRKHPRAWYSELFRARRDTREAACDEAVAMFRQQLRDEENKTKFDAANAVAKYFGNPRSKPRAGKPKDAPTEFLDVLAAVPETRTTRVDLHLQAAQEETRQSKIDE